MAWNDVQDERQAEKLNILNSSELTETIDGVDWYTYTNNSYGYQISYPENVLFERSSEMEGLLEQTEAAKKDAMIFIKDAPNEFMHTTSAVVSPDFKAFNIDELRTFYTEESIKEHMKNNKRLNRNLKPEDFTITETTYDGRQAIEVIHPIGYTIMTYNDKGTFMGVSALKYDGATTTEKDRNTKKIMETFKVLD